MKPPELKQLLGALVLDRAPCYVAVIDSSYRLVFANSAFVATFGEGEGRPCYAVYKGRASACEHCPAARTFAGGEEVVFDEVGHAKDGSATAYRVRTLPVHGPKGGVSHAVQIAQDTTHLVELERGLKQAERLAAVGLTAAGMAHTIKNILSGLDGGRYMVDTGLDLQQPERLRAGWTMVGKYLEQLATLVKNLLRYSKVEAPRREAVAPAALLGDVVDLFREKARVAGVELTHSAAVELAPLLVDREAMHAALSNLVANAVDACMWDPDDEKAHRISVTAAPRAGGGAVLEVCDNGPGISEENQRKVLSTFFTTKGMRGTGMGLLLTKKAVEEHGGGISFRSTPGQGTTFHIELPAAEAAVAESSLPGASSAA